ncbi:MAG: Metal-sensitive transcriptional repressor family protein [Mitsuokella multacida]
MGMKQFMRKCMDEANLHRRLKKIIGQVNAIDRMIEEDIPCEDVLSQINAAKSALNKCGQIVLEGHINHCVKEAIEKGDEEEIKTFTKAIERFANMQ